MSYARRQSVGSNRTVAIVIVVLIHLILGYALITGLAYSVVQRTVETLTAVNVVEEPPPPPAKPPPPKKTPETPPPIVAPPAIVRTRIAPPIVRTVPDAPPPVITPTAPIAPPAPPAPPPPKVKPIPPRSAVGNLQGLFTADDYPPSAIRRDEEGIVTVRLTVSTNGRVADCEVTRSSGSPALDSTACSVLKRRSRFKPATDSHGDPTTDTVTQRIHWVLQS